MTVLANRKALITGITGQDGSYLAELLLRQGYEVHGIIRRTSTDTLGNLSDAFKVSDEGGGALKLHSGDLGDCASLQKIINSVAPAEVYSLIRSASLYG